MFILLNTYTKEKNENRSLNEVDFQVVYDTKIDLI